MRNFICAISAAVFLSLSSSAMATPVGTVEPIATYDPPFGVFHITEVEADLNSYLASISDVLNGSGFQTKASGRAA